MMNLGRKLFYLTILLLTFVFGGCGNFSGNYEEIESSTSIPKKLIGNPQSVPVLESTCVSKFNKPFHI